MDSAVNVGTEDSAANAWAACVGELGDEGPFSSRRRFLMASACRFGGPRRLLGRSKVQGISRAAQARQGGPDSSHYSNRERTMSAKPKYKV